MRAFCLFFVFWGATALTFPEDVNNFQEKWLEISEEIASNPDLQESFQESMKLSREQIKKDLTWNCPPLPSQGEPNTVHELTPADIDIVAAMGDSITAGNGIFGNTAPEVALEHRGESFSIGGDGSLESNVITLTNILRKYNPSVTGYSTGTGPHNFPNSNLNVAIPGDIARGMPDQANTLIRRLKNDPDKYDYNNDWKVVTLLIGGNDLCAVCNNPTGGGSADNYAAYIEEALDILHAEVPRMFVNLVAMCGVEFIRDYSTGITCNLLQQSLCPCAMNEEDQAEIKQVQLGYYDRLRALVDSGKYDTRDDFTVVLQPFLVDQEPPLTNNGQPDPRWLAGDCFHPSLDTHQAVAVLLWNNMFIPEGEKPFEYPWVSGFGFPQYHCPSSAQPYFQTRLN